MRYTHGHMKKFAPVFAVVGAIIIGVVVFSLIRGTVEAPEGSEAGATTTDVMATSSTSGSSLGVGLPANITKVVKVYANPSWDIRLRYDPEWSLNQNGEVVSINSVSANFMVSKEQPIAEPARVEKTETTRTILGEAVEVTRFEKPNDSYAFYEYFTLRVDGNEYYFKISSIIDPNPKVEEFIKNISAQ